MSVRIVRLKNGEDIISDIYEVTSNADSENEEDKQPVAYQLRHPYSIFIRPGMNIDVDVDGGNIHKLSDPEVVMEPWLPLCKHDHIFFRIDEVTAAYETHDTVIEQYTQLIEAKINGQREDATPDPKE
jgi:hypothetical protein